MLNNLASLENQNGTMVILALQISVEHTPNWCILGAFHQLINANCTHVLYPCAIPLSSGIQITE